MDKLQRAVAGAGLLLLAIALQLDNALERLKKKIRVQPEPLKHGTFRLTGIAPNRSAKRAMLAASLIFGAMACLVGALAVHGGLGHILAYCTFAFGAAGTFALESPTNAPLPQYTFLGVYTGGSSDTSPLDIPFATYNPTFAARCNGVAPIPNVFVVQAVGNTETMAPTCTATNFVLTFTTSGSGLAGFVATIGATIPNTVVQP